MGEIALPYMYAPAGTIRIQNLLCRERLIMYCALYSEFPVRASIAHMVFALQVMILVHERLTEVKLYIYSYVANKNL